MKAEWQAWVDLIDQITSAVTQTFTGLDQDQLNWKPSAREWSIAQCLDHLLVTNRTYYPKFSGLLEGQAASRFWTSLPGWAKLWGQFIYWSVDPPTSRYFPAPTLFKPAQNQINANIIEDFGQNQEVLKSWLAKLADMDFERTYITSPISSIVVYSLKDTFRILVTHERLHFQQAKRVLELMPVF
jgi:hypothetical protein